VWNRCKRQERNTKDTKERLAQKEEDTHKCNAKHKNRKTWKDLDTLSVWGRKGEQGHVFKRIARNTKCSSLKDVEAVKVS